MNEKRFHVCILSATLTDQFSKELIRGAITAAKQLDVNLTVIPGKYLGIQGINDSFEAYYEYQYNVLFCYAAKAHFDYIIAPVGTIAYAYNNELKKEFLDRFAGTPVLCVASAIEGYDCLEFDNTAGITAAVNYLAEHGRKHIGIMAGRPENCECIERCEAYRKSLKDNGLVFKDSYLMYCDMSYDCQKEAESLLDRNPELDAVICINDIIASVVYDVIRERGKIIGKDIAVTGFDDQFFAREMTPPLATVKADAFQLGMVSVEKAYNYLKGIQDDRHLVGTRFIPRKSCIDESRLSDEEKTLFQEDTDGAEIISAAKPERYIKRTHLENLFIRDSLMFGGNLKDSYAGILKRLCNIGSVTSYLYILEDPVEHFNDSEYAGSRQWLFKSYAYGANCFNIPENEQRMDTGTVFEHSLLVSDRTRILIAANLFSAEMQYGLVLLEPENFDFFDEIELITYQLSSAVRSLDILKNLNNLLTDTRLALAMANDYQYIYCVDIENGSYTQYERERTDKDFGLKVRGEDFFTDLRKECDEKVYDEDKVFFQNMFNKETFLNGLERGEFFGFDYRYKKNGQFKYHRLKTITGTAENQGTVFIGVSDIDQQKRQQLKADEERLRFARISNALAARFEMIYYINIVTGEYIVYASGNKDTELSVIEQGEDYFSQAVTNAEKFVHPDDLEMVKKHVRKDNLLLMLQEDESFSLSYRQIIDGNIQYMNMNAVRMADDDDYVIIAVNNVTAAKLREMEIQAELFTDPLTKVKNKAAYTKNETKMDMLIRENLCGEFSVFVFDLNDLKKINDNLGHDEGDKYIRSGARLICETFKHSPVFRIGGDEFAAILTGNDYEIRERLKMDMKEKVADNIRNGRVVVAAGNADYVKGQDTCLLDVFKRADQEMYAEKHRLKCVSDPEIGQQRG